MFFSDVENTKDASSFHALVKFIGWRSFCTAGAQGKFDTIKSSSLHQMKENH